MKTIIKRTLKKFLRFPSSCITKIIFFLTGTICGINFSVGYRPPILSLKYGSLKIGNNVCINSSVRANLIGKGSRTIFHTVGNGKILIGNNVGISNSCFVARSSITIEDDVTIGGGACIYDNDFHSLDFSDRSNLDVDILIKPVVLEKGCFVGAGATILKGVTIGEYSIIGAESVVTKNIPSREIWAGNPARFIRKLEK